MRYTEEMMLQSKSGFCMPFEERMLRYSLLSFFWKADSLSFNAHKVLERSAPG